MESLAPRSAQAQLAVRRRYVPIYLPNGSAPWWTPATIGSDDAWQLSPILEPLSAVKAKMTVLTNLENGTSFNADRSSSVEPSHGRQPGAWLTSMDPGVVRQQMGVEEANTPSVDQLIAKALAGQTPLDSLRVGLSTTSSFCDGQPCSNSRTVSWSEANLPMYKMVDPLEVFNAIAGVATPSDGMPSDMPDPELARRIAMNQSVLDAVLNNGNATYARLGALDQQRYDQFLTAVREVELKATDASRGLGGLACTLIDPPTLSDSNNPVFNDDYARQNTETYNKGDHADVMNDLIVMAFQCDATRVVTYMLEDERSEFAYDHVTLREFTEDGSTETSGTCGEYHNGGQHGNPNEFGAITWWNTTKVADLCTKLDAIQEEDGRTVLDNTLIMYGAAMHASNHACTELPMPHTGSGGGAIRTTPPIDYDGRWLRDLHHTVMTRMYGMSGPEVDSFGADRPEVPRAELAEIVAT
jgi:hypothetical protein